MAQNDALDSESASQDKTRSSHMAAKPPAVPSLFDAQAALPCAVPVSGNRPHDATIVDDQQVALGVTLAQRAGSCTAAPLSDTLTLVPGASAVVLPQGVVLGRTTVLPRVEAIDGAGPQLVVENRVRYERVRALGEGGVGEVALAHDHDIQRTVAVKRLKPENLHPASVVRFVEEIRTIGCLEHPNIVPIHDVGIDEQGQYFFVMKYVDGETLESVIDKLAAGDPAYIAKYSYEQRTQVFLGVLRAIQYAHAQGIVHRDIKPANVMLGRYGEVVMMDWGLAKRTRGASVANLDSLDAAAERRDARDIGEHVLATRQGALLGTPAYMSPEQAAGRIDAIDERSDVYSLCVLFHELLTLRHYLADKTSVGQLVLALTEPGEYVAHERVAEMTARGVPAELAWFVARGLERDPARRFQSVAEMIAALEDIAAGRISVKCPITAMKRGGKEALRFVDRHPRMAMAGVAASFGLVVAAGVDLVLRLLGR